jgi:hypothetical protein
MSARKKKNEQEELEAACRVIEPSDFLQGTEWEDYIRELCARHKSRGFPGYTVIRRDDGPAPRDMSALPPGMGEPGPGVPPQVFHVSGMRAFVLTLKGRGRRRECAQHKGEEFVLVQKGSIKIFLGEDEIILKEGDSVYYPSSIPHRIENRTFRKSVILAVICGA